MHISIRRIYDCASNFFDRIMDNFLLNILLTSGLLALTFWTGKILLGRIFYLLSKMGL